MAQPSQAERIRELVAKKYIGPQLRAGNTRFTIRVRDVLKDAEATAGFPRGRTPLICNVLQGKAMLNQNGLQIESVDGPPSKQSTTAVVHYSLSPRNAQAPPETSSQRAKRLTEKLRGLWKQELAEYGGAEGFIRWIRSDEVPAA